MMITLEEIIRNKKRELSQKKESKFNFLASILKPKRGELGVIAEIKLATPVAGVLGSSNEVVERAVKYQMSSADAISIVVEEKYFGGKIEFINQVRKAVSLPILMKDFVIDPYQIYEAKIYGADAVLLIAKIVSGRQLKRLVKIVESVGMTPVVEINDEIDLKKAIGSSAMCLAVNSRNLNTFEVDVDSACELIKNIPSHFPVLGFSGILGRPEAKKYKEAGVRGVLIGTALMKTKNSEEFIKNIKGI